MANTLASGFLLNGRYRILDLAEGASGRAVYKAEDTRLGGRVVAVKEMTADNLNAQEIAQAAAAFQHEAHLLASLHHSSLPAIHDYFSTGGRWYLVMEFIEGETLEKYLQLHGTPGLPVADVLLAADQICAVLEYLHGCSPPVIFRDLKPSNIMVTSSGHIFLIDFGIARIFKPGQSHDTVAMGTVGYAAPEQYGKSQTTVRSDIYSFGVTLYQLLTGIDPSDKPFTIAPIQPLNPRTPPQLEALIRWMVQLDESKRPVDIAVVRNELDQITRQSAIASLVVPPQQVPAYPAYTLPSYSAPAHPEPPANASTPIPRRRARIGRYWAFGCIGAALAIVCTVTVVCSSLSNVLGLTATTAATQVPTATNTPPPSVATFQSSQTYTYDVMIGQSTTTTLTNFDVDVTVQTLTVNGAGGGTLLVVGFFDYGTQKETKLAFHTLAHVYLIDNAGNRYQSMSVSPSQLEVQPRQSGTVQVMFPALPPTVTWLDLYLNSDLETLDTQCVQMLPNGVTSSC